MDKRTERWVPLRNPLRRTLYRGGVGFCFCEVRCKEVDPLKEHDENVAQGSNLHRFLTLLRGLRRGLKGPEGWELEAGHKTRCARFRLSTLWFGDRGKAAPSLYLGYSPREQNKNEQGHARSHSMGHPKSKARIHGAQRSAPTCLLRHSNGRIPGYRAGLCRNLKV